MKARACFSRFYGYIDISTGNLHSECKMFTLSAEIYTVSERYTQKVCEWMDTPNTYDY